MTERLEKLIPWEELLELICPHYFVSGHRGRQPYDLELMLRIHLVQIIYNLSDPQIETQRSSKYPLTEAMAKVTELDKQVSALELDAKLLQKEVETLRMQKDILRKCAELLKKRRA